MSDFATTATVNVTYTNGAFAYSLVGSAQGWTVKPDGQITAPKQPSGSFVPITVNLTCNSATQPFAGFWLGTSAPTTTPPPSPWPTGVNVYYFPNGTWSGPLQIVLTQAKQGSSPYYYSLALALAPGGTVKWDDPKILDDGSS